MVCGTSQQSKIKQALGMAGTKGLRQQLALLAACMSQPLKAHGCKRTPVRFVHIKPSAYLQTLDMEDLFASQHLQGNL